LKEPNELFGFTRAGEFVVVVNDKPLAVRLLKVRCECAGDPASHTLGIRVRREELPHKVRRFALARIDPGGKIFRQYCDVPVGRSARDPNRPG
jgi:hypothetical protein